MAEPVITPPLPTDAPDDAVETSAANGERSAIVASFWVIVLIGLPFWWATTSIERHALPTSEVAELVKLQPCPLQVPVSFDALLPVELQEATRQRLQDYAASSDIWQCLRFTAGGNDAGVEAQAAQTTHVDLAQRLMPKTSESDFDARVAKYSSRYKLVFSLLFQDAAEAGRSPQWEVEAALGRAYAFGKCMLALKPATGYILPIAHALAPLHNFSIETQIQHFAPLHTEIVAVEGEGSVIEEDQLKAFVNSADWNLASTATLDPALHFLLYVPTGSAVPMHLRVASGALIPSNAFISPQWGGVVILNPPSIDVQLSAQALDTPFSLFVQQLRTLLGVPLNGKLAPEREQIEAMLRRTAIANARETVETLAGILKLATEIRNMRVARSVGRGVAAAIADLKQAQYAASIGDLDAMSRHAARAHEHAERAFFDPDMLALLYFPAEHVYAVYTPLFGPIAVPLVMALLREVKARRARHAAKLHVE